MISARLLTARFSQIAVVIALVASLAFAAPAAKSKSRKGGSGKAAKVSKKSSGKRVAKSNRRGKSRVVARRSKRGGRVVYARARGKRGRWRRQVVRSAPAYHRSGIQNYLTQSWANAQAGTQQGGPNADATPTMTAEAINPSPSTTSSAPAMTAGGNGVDAASPANSSLTMSGPISLNPLVLAYASSLQARGHNVDSQGFIVTTMNGEVLAEHNADRPFNPASVVKIMTSLVAISKLGPDYRFRTSLYTDGLLDSSTGTLKGSLYIIGSGDPAFFYENAMLIADKLNRSGIYSVEGNLVVLGPFYYNLSASRDASAKAFRKTLTPDTWTSGAKTAYNTFLAMRAAEDQMAAANGQKVARPVQGGPPSLRISGETLNDAAIDTSNLRLLAVHTSLPLVRVLKGLNDFSNNWMAHRIGDLVGGPDAVERFLQTQVGLSGEEVGLVTASGLGANHVSPRATIQILRKLAAYLQKEGLGMEEMLPVGGVDEGTLKRRFNDMYRGSVVAKTGTLSGVSTLAGVAHTRSRGPLLFVIFNRGGSTASFRAAQDETIKKLITFFGGPVSVRYSPFVKPVVSEDAAGGNPGSHSHAGQQ